MALRNGVVVHGPTSWSVAVRGRDGRIDLASGPKPRLRGQAVYRIPGLRGLARLGEALAVVPAAKRRLPAARLAFQDPAVGTALAGASLATTVLRRRLQGGLVVELVAGLAGTIPALISLRAGELAAYHGAEHKAIAAYETGEEASATEPEHDRCGSNLIAPLVLALIAGNLVATRVQTAERIARPLVVVASLAFATEVFTWSERHPDAGVARAVHRAGFEIQHRIGTSQPTEAQLAVAAAGLSELLRVERAAGPKADEE